MKFLRYGLAIALVVVIALAVAGCSKTASSKGELAATVNGKDITMKEVDERLVQLTGQNTEMFKGEQGETMKAQFRQRVLDQLVEMELILQEVEKQGITTNDKEIDAKVKELMKSLNIKDEKALEQALKQQKMTMEQFRSEVEKRIKIEKLGEKMTKDLKITDKEIADYYKKNPAEFAAKDEIQAAHILVQKEEQARNILKEVKNGGDFAKLAKKYSIDPGSKDNGGQMPMTPKDQFVPEFSNAAWALKPGGVSEPVKTSYGFHIIKLIDKKSGAQKTLKQATADIKTKIKQQKQQEQFAKWLEGIKKKATIKSFIPAAPAPAPAPSAPAAGGTGQPQGQSAPQAVPQAGK